MGCCFMTKFNFYSTQELTHDLNNIMETQLGIMSVTSFSFTLKYFSVYCLTKFYRKSCAMLSKEEMRIYNEDVEESLRVYKLQAYIMIGKSCRS